MQPTCLPVGRQVGNLKDSDLGKFFKKIAFRKGRQAAITATASKIAVILWNMVTKRQAYNPVNLYVFLDEKRRAIAQLRKKIAKFGIDPNELGVFSRERYRLAYEKRISDNQGASNETEHNFLHNHTDNFNFVQRAKHLSCDKKDCNCNCW